MACYDSKGILTPCPDNGDAGSGGPGSGDNYVSMPDSTKGFYSAGKGGFGNKTVRPEQAKAAVVLMNQSEQKRLSRLFQKVAPQWGFETPRSMWSFFVDAVQNSEQTPWDAIEAAATGKIESPNMGPAAGSGGGGGGGGPYRREAIDFTNETSARSLVDRALGDYLGRAATEKEAAKFYATLTKAQQANPVVEQGYQSGSGSATSTRDGGVLPEQLAKDFAMSRDDYAEVQVETTAKSLIEQAIRQAGQNRII